MALRLYLAGPDVFAPDARALGDRRRAQCEKYGFEGLFPLDGAIDVTAQPPAATAELIYRRDVAMMEAADGCIANITPFRGPNADDGTSFEIGWMIARGKPVWAYDNRGGTMGDKVAAWPGLGDDPGYDTDGLQVEHFGQAANLMLTQSIRLAGGAVVSRAAADPFGLANHEECLRLASAFAGWPVRDR